MFIEVKPFGAVGSFEDFCLKHKIILTAHERAKSITQASRWYVSANKLVVIRKDGFLRSVCGNGNSPIEALGDFANQILGEKLLVGGYDGEEVIVPNAWD